MYCKISSRAPSNYLLSKYQAVVTVRNIFGHWTCSPGEQSHSPNLLLPSVTKSMKLMFKAKYHQYTLEPNNEEIILKSNITFVINYVQEWHLKNSED